MRFTQLKAYIRGITPKAPSETLRAMEYDGLSRTDLGGKPPHVEYALTPRGDTLLPPLSALREWAGTHVPDIERARAAADSQRS